ncbi:MAG: ribonuclease E/G, partial [Parasporobacterium sp.]|nr:ribonuclease E/G [Parasporobacterium sp.]
KAREKKVWLSSGAYLVIEQTEALTVVDVNTGKADPKRTSSDDFFLRVNEEAAKELFVQIRLRNLSWIIIADFISMRSEAHNKCLLETIKKIESKEKLGVSLVDMTKLGLVELTRKKESDTLAAQLKKAGIL